jgi:hypothetical protein
MTALAPWPGRALAGAALLAVPLCPFLARAQGAIPTTASSTTLPRATSWLGGAATLDQGRWFLDAAGRFGIATDGRPAVDLGGTFRAVVPTATPLALHIEARGRSAPSWMPGTLSTLGGEARLAWNAGATGFSVLADAAQLRHGEWTHGAGIGAWRTLRQVLLSVDLVNRSVRDPGSSGSTSRRSIPDSVWNDTSQQFVSISRSVTSVDSGAASRTAAWREVEVRAQWAGARLSLTAQGGMRLATPQARWGEFEAVLQAFPRAAVVAGAGWEPMASLIGDRRGASLSLGLRLSPAPRRPRPTLGASPEAAGLTVEIVPGAGGARRLRVRAPFARRVEMAGDFTGWQPVLLAPDGRGAWSAALPIAPGLHRVVLRFDGGRWVPPEGVPRVADDFGGESGVVSVP